ncbi:MAG: DoxX family membrane protein [Bifidobacteriaceae bacterium]|jgi:uncharacterized membrane protein YphA (DoxX/SURF4 family)|nr:DoxX family membrane protein [Bifidobacteriaceae bacterium]
MSLLRFLARAMIAGPIIAEGTAVWRHPEPHESAVQPLVNLVNQHSPQEIDAQQTVKASGAILIGSGTLIGLGLLARLGGLGTAVVLAPAALAGHRFWQVKDSQLRASARSTFFRQIALAGAGLLIATTRRRNRVD